MSWPPKWGIPPGSRRLRQSSQSFREKPLKKNSFPFLIHPNQPLQHQQGQQKRPPHCKYRNRSPETQAPQTQDAETQLAPPESNRGEPLSDTTVALPLQPAGLIPQVIKGINSFATGPFPLVIFTTGRPRPPSRLFSQDPQELINLLESVLFTHQPTWDNI